MVANPGNKHNKKLTFLSLLLQGIYNGNVTATDQNNQEIFCIDFNYKF